ncbi:hypothetical protein T06_16076 [Trichinella sp. T6]|nr:hypothetical protein T06_16076 [Trichinella sp. T6]
MVGSVESNGQVLEQEAWMFSLSYSSNICDVQLSPLGNLCCDVWSRLWPAYMRITRLLCIEIVFLFDNGEKISFSHSVRILIMQVIICLVFFFCNAKVLAKKERKKPRPYSKLVAHSFSKETTFSFTYYIKQNQSLDDDDDHDEQSKVQLVITAHVGIKITTCQLKFDSWRKFSDLEAHLFSASLIEAAAHSMRQISCSERQIFAISTPYGLSALHFLGQRRNKTIFKKGNDLKNCHQLLLVAKLHWKLGNKSMQRRACTCSVLEKVICTLATLYTNTLCKICIENNSTLNPFFPVVEQLSMWCRNSSSSSVGGGGGGDSSSNSSTLSSGIFNFKRYKTFVAGFDSYLNGGIRSVENGETQNIFYYLMRFQY